jgi:uncharacterized membrane protein YhaH (DUF805 family)
MPPPPEAFRSGARDVPGPPDFGSAVVTCLRKAFRARGRASPEEFWYFAVLWLCVGAGAVVLGLSDNDFGAVATDVLTCAWMLLIVPLIAVGIRRLHDTGRSGGWCWLGVSLVGLIVLIALCSGASEPHRNRFGD